MTRKKEKEIASDFKNSGTADQRKELVKQTKDNILKIKRAKNKVEGECIVCGKKIKKNQAFRVLPHDKKCQEERLYHLRTCGPGSENWNIFKASGKRTPLGEGQMSFKWRWRKG